MAGYTYIQFRVPSHTEGYRGWLGRKKKVGVDSYADGTMFIARRVAKMEYYNPTHEG